MTAAGSLTSRSARNRLVAALVRRELDPFDPALRLKRKYVEQHREGCDPATGFCSIAADAVWAMLGGNEAGYHRMRVRHEGDGHWFVVDILTGEIIDPTASQFSTPVPYHEAKRAAPPTPHSTGHHHRGKWDLLITAGAKRLIERVEGAHKASLDASRRRR